jgi:DNA mismatch repair ATPase MutS
MEQTLIRTYEALALRYQWEADRQKLKLSIVSWLRLACFLAIIASVVFLIIPGHSLGWFVGLALLIAFLAMVKWSVIIEKKLNFFLNLVTINQNELKAIRRDYSCFDPGTEFTNPDHDYSYDLDLFGSASFFQFLNRTITSEGKKRLAQSVLKNDLDVARIGQRQQAIDELAQQLDWRQSFLASGLTGNGNDPSEINILHNPVPEIRGLYVLKIVLIALPAITVLLGVFMAFGIVPDQLFYLAVFAQWALFIGYSKTIRQFKKAFGLKSKILHRYIDMLHLMEKQSFQSAYLTNLKKKLYHQNQPASQITSSLQKILNELDYSQNILVGFVLDSLLLWDLRCVFRLQKWHSVYGKCLEEWLEVIAEFDSLISLANLNYNHPEWCVPEPNDGKFILKAENLGHPLIAREKRVDNPFHLGDEQQIVIVTGANMAGKSTFLRTVGVNLILASMGCRVCAASFRFSPVRLFTNMRTSDNLMKDESYFYAELLRLKQVLDLLHRGENLFVIIDEMLKGTNSVDKLNGSVELLKQLIQLSTHCIVATHDLKLTELANQYPNVVKNQCFEVNLSGEELSFDYRLRDGVTGTMNATFLMKKMGIIP